MAKVDKEYTWRMHGMTHALEVAKKSDIDGLEKEVRIMKVHDDYEKIEKHNKDTFQANGMRHGSELMYRCTVCGNLTNLDGSFSQQGHHLICTGCVKKNGGLPTMMKWIYQE